MSKVEVNQVTQQCGTTLTVGGGACKTAVVDATTVTLGRCGGTVSLASGATQSGFGRTGTVDWQTGDIKTATFTAVSGKGYFCNTTGGVLTVNLPAGAAGSIVSLADYAATWQTNNVTVTPNGTDKIGGTNSSVTLSTEGQSVTLVYVDSTQGWVNTMDSTSNVRAAAYVTATVSGACNTLTTVCTNYKLAKFVGPGTFCVSCAGNAAGSTLVDYLVVAGGGGAYGNKFHNTAGAGAGAGGLRASADTYTIGAAPAAPKVASPAVALTVSVSGYPITVGGGGAGGTGSPGCNPTAGSNGANTVFSSITSTGGGFGGMTAAPDNVCAGPGGSGGGKGGGGTWPGPGYGNGNTPPVTPSQGYPGGTATGPCANIGTAGGGGAMAAGASGSPSGGGAGGAGAGFPTVAVGTAGQNCGSYYYFSGGAGGSTYYNNPSPNPGGSGGLGGGGDGKAGNASPSLGENGTVNTGGGGAAPGASCTPTSFRAGGSGGSGIVIIRYKFQ